MDLAIAEARKGVGKTSPNPAVGAVIVKDDSLISSGFHAAAGEDHAEVAALRKVAFKAEGCDLYTTLEPCNHTGRTGPCTEKIIAAGIKRVIIGALDPNPSVAGGGTARLEEAGIEVVTGGPHEAACIALNEPFNFAVVQRRSMAVLKWAMTLDGKIATRSGQSKWITSDAARADGRRLRAELDGIIVGVDTVIADDPALTARIEDARDPTRIVMDSTLRTPPDAQLVQTAGDTPTLIACTDRGSVEAEKRLTDLGCRVIRCAAHQDRVDPADLLGQLFEAGLNGVVVEGGQKVHGAFRDRDVADKFIIYVAPSVMGGEGARGPVGGLGADTVAEVMRLDRVETSRIGLDIKIVGYRR